MDETGLILLQRVRVARTFLQRARGLLGCRALSAEEGLWLEPCNAVHMVGMRIGLDVVFLSRAGEILRCVPSLRPWRMVRCRAACSTLEVAVGTIRRFDLHAGKRLILCEQEK
jgi:uncharacterized membrane protein (UPF0127 family)